MSKELTDYTITLLHAAGCDEYTYGETDGETIINDLKEAFPNGMAFPYIDVANEIEEAEL